MRRKYFGLAIAALATLGPLQAWGGDREIAEQIIARLKSSRDSGALKDFTLDMKVDQGVVLFRGSVKQQSQRQLVLQAADGIDGITKVVDEVDVSTDDVGVVKPQTAVAINESAVEEARPIDPAAGSWAEAAPAIEELAVTEVAEQQDFSFRQALAAQANAMEAGNAPPVMPGEIRRTAAEEPNDDAQIVAAVVSALSRAKQAGELRGFGVDVKSQNGVLHLSGRAGSPAQRDSIIAIAESVPGVAGIREEIAVPTSAPNLPRLPEPPSLQDVANSAPMPTSRLQRPAGVPAMTAAYPGGLAAPYQTLGAATAGQTMTAPVAGQPVPMAPYSAVGAPRYDSPNLPNYAWPGYAAHPNYAALTYPQQYSPSAWPYIGPFYPYPQVPLGWRKVSLEWDDGWWFLDFTDR